MIAMRTNRLAMLKAATKSLARSQKGNALVEFAVVMPFFLTLVLLMITFSLAEFNRTILTYATAAGARAGAKYVSGTNQMTQANIKARATTAFTAACGNRLVSFSGPLSVPSSPFLQVTFSATTPQMVIVTARLYYMNMNTFYLDLSQYMQIGAATAMTIEQ